MNISFKKVWGHSGFVSKILFILIVIYAFVSIYVLLCSLGVIDKDKVIPSNDDLFWIIYSIISFAVATIIASFHLGTMIFRKEKMADHIRHIEDHSTN